MAHDFRSLDRRFNGRSDNRAHTDDALAANGCPSGNPSAARGSAYRWMSPDTHHTQPARLAAAGFLSRVAQGMQKPAGNKVPEPALCFMRGGMACRTACPHGRSSQDFGPLFGAVLFCPGLYQHR